MDHRYTRDIGEVARDYARFGLIHRRRYCPYCSCQMILMRNTETRGQMCFQCGRCGVSKGVTMNTPLCYIDIKTFDIAIYLWIDGAWPRLAQNVVRSSNEVMLYFQVIRKAMSLYEKTKILPYLKLEGPVEIDETRLGRQKLKACSMYARKINRIMGLYDRATDLLVLYYIPDRRHSTLSRIAMKHIQLGSAIITDTMSSYVRPRSETSRLEQYGYYHYWFDVQN